MVEIFSRHRALALLVAAVAAQVLLLAYQIKRNRDVRLIRYWAVELVTPVQRGGTWTSSGINGIWSGYIGLRNAHKENERLRSDLDRLEIRNRELESQASEGQRLATLLSFRNLHAEAPMLAAQVIGASADSSSHTLFINRGEDDKVHRNMAVITPDGIVGKIVEVFPGASQVLLINDRESGVGAMFADTRTHGVVKGSGDPEPRMDYVVNDEKVHDGETILTSGEDRIFPKGLLIGVVSGEVPGTPFQNIRVKAAARLDRLEDVIVLLSLQDLIPKESEATASVVPPPPPLPPPAVKASTDGSGASASSKTASSGTVNSAGQSKAPPHSATPAQLSTPSPKLAAAKH